MAYHIGFALNIGVITSAKPPGTGGFESPFALCYSRTQRVGTGLKYIDFTLRHKDEPCCPEGSFDGTDGYEPDAARESADSGGG